MKIASFNINNINRRLTNLLTWLREAEPDIVCLQELRRRIRCDVRRRVHARVAAGSVGAEAWIMSHLLQLIDGKLTPSR
jgi:exodeoxyribonuclease-3